jgi:hypothetical protein
MNCEDFSNVVLDIAREQLLEAGVRVAALDHAGRCDHCRVRLAAEQQLSRQLRALSQAMRPFGAAPRIDARVIAACRSRSTVFNLRMPQRRKTWAAIAAMVLLLIGLGVRWRHVLLRPNNSTPGQSRTAEIQPSPPNNAMKPSSDSPIKTVHQVIAHKSKSIASRSPTLRSPNSDRQGLPLSSAVTAKNEIATDFFSVGDTSALSLADGGQLVRVELPRSALMRFGLPVNTDRASERVKADVLVGADGIARAIRFVR